MHFKYKNTPLHMLPVETSMNPKETINNTPRYTKSEFKRPSIRIPLHFTKKIFNIQCVLSAQLRLL